MSSDPSILARERLDALDTIYMEKAREKRADEARSSALHHATEIIKTEMLKRDVLTGKEQDALLTLALRMERFLLGLQP